MPAKTYDIAIIGAGAGGLMASTLLEGKDVALFEGNPMVGAKIKISGGGRCNITNRRLTTQNYLGDGDFVAAVLAQFGPGDLLRFLAQRGLVPKERKEGQYFCPHSSDEILDLFKKGSAHADLYLGTKILGVQKSGDFLIRSSQGYFGAKKVVVTSGGLSYPKIGASAIGYEIASHFGHDIVAPRPALVGLTLQSEQAWMRELSGVSLKVTVRVGERSIKGDLLFAHKGLSGPAILNASLYWEKGRMFIDFLAGEPLGKYLSDPSKQPSTLLPLPKRFTKAFLSSLGLKDKPLKGYSRQEQEKIGLLGNYELAPAGHLGYAKAEVTKGGVSTGRIDPKTMQSLLCEGLYFAGEVLDVTGELGGYNFQWAFSSAYVCAKALTKN